MDEAQNGGVALDWKAVGNDFLAAFPLAYPAMEFLRNKAFNALQAQCANESAETCFDVLSRYLATHAHQLWSVDTGGDAYQVHVVAASAVDAFVAACADAGDEGRRCERLAPDAPCRKAPGAPKKPLPALVESTDWHRQYGSLYDDACVVRHAIVPFENESEAFDLLVDLDVFPPEEIRAEGFFAMRDEGHRFHRVHATSDGHYWEWEPAVARKGLPPHRRVTLVRVTDYRTPTLVEVEGSEASLHDGGERSGWGDVLCLARATRPDATWFDAGAPVIDVLAPVGGGEEALVSLLCVEGLRLRHLASLSRGTGLQVRLLAADRLLVLRAQPWTEAAEGAMDYFLLDTQDASVLARGQLPHPAGSIGPSLYPLDGSGALYVRHETRPHPSHPHLREKTGRLVQLDLHERRWREAKLEGLHNDWSENMALRRGQPADRHRIRSFEGHVVFTQGHAGVVVMNYLTNYSGKHDAAWLWDRRDDRVTILRPSDFGGGTPTVRYLPAMQRYVADDSCRLDLLVPHAQIQATRPQTSLTWEAWRPLG